MACGAYEDGCEGRAEAGHDSLLLFLGGGSVSTARLRSCIRRINTHHHRYCVLQGGGKGGEPGAQDDRAQQGDRAEVEGVVRCMRPLANAWTLLWVLRLSTGI